mgnify:CR=1 FL=1
MTKPLIPATVSGMSHFLIFGTHPRLSLAEYRAVQNLPDSPIICGNGLVVHADDWDGDRLMNLLGGTVKLGDVLGSLTLDTLNAESLLQILTPLLPTRSFDFGLSVFGGGRKAKNVTEKLPIKLKKAFKSVGLPSRWVSGEHGSELSPAAVSKLKLTTEGLDLCLLIEGETVYVGRTTNVQDADAWSLRDYGRPMRDEKNGMLPPKLARMMVNLAQTPNQGILIDPFCGGGTIAMEAALATQAKTIISSDIEAKQVSDTKKNIDWLLSHGVLQSEDEERFYTFQSDARQIEKQVQVKIDVIVTEGYLGPALRGSEDLRQLERNAETITKLWEDSLKHFLPLLSPTGRIVGIWPAFKTAQGIARVDLSDRLESLGYRMVDPVGEWETSGGPLVYMRPEQHVSRRIVILEPISRS